MLEIMPRPLFARQVSCPPCCITALILVRAPFYRVLRGRGFGQDLLGWDLQEQCLRLIAVGVRLFVACGLGLCTPRRLGP